MPRSLCAVALGSCSRIGGSLLRFARECVAIASRRDTPREMPLMDFPLAGLMDEDACYARLVAILHPGGLACQRCGGDRLGVHRAHRAPVLDYRCRDCR